MPFAVSKYQDTYSERRKPSADSSDGRWELGRFDWFDHEWQAKRFIRERAKQELDKVKKELKRAEARVKKCNEKFPYELGEGSGMEFLLERHTAAKEPE